MLPGSWAYVSAGAFGRAIIVSFNFLFASYLLYFFYLNLATVVTNRNSNDANRSLYLLHSDKLIISLYPYIVGYFLI